MRIRGRLLGSPCVLRPDPSGHRGHHHPDYWILCLVGAAILLLRRFSTSVETGLLSDTWGAVWVSSHLLVGIRPRRALLRSSRMRTAFCVCKVSRPITVLSDYPGSFKRSSVTDPGVLRRHWDQSSVTIHGYQIRYHSRNLCTLILATVGTRLDVLRQ